MPISARRDTEPRAGYWLIEAMAALVLLVLSMVLAASILQTLSWRLAATEKVLRERLELREELLE